MEIHVLPLHPQLNEVGGERRLSFFFFFVPVMSPILLIARVPYYKHFLLRIIFFGFIGTASAENVKHL